MFGTLRLGALLLSACVLVTHAGPAPDANLAKRWCSTETVVVTTTSPTTTTATTTVTTPSPTTTTQTVVVTTPSPTTTTATTTVTTQGPCPSGNFCGNGNTAVCCNNLSGKVDCEPIDGTVCSGTVVCCNANDSIQVCIGSVVGDKNHVQVHINNHC